MKAVSWNDFLKNSPWQNTRTSVTLGVFDGVHRGHQSLFRRLSEDDSALPIVFTFRVNPASLTRSKTFKGNILTLPQKLERMENFGVKGAVIIDFSPDFSKLTGRKFFSFIEKNTLLSRVVLGENHRLGHHGEAGAEDAQVFLKKQGVDVFIEESVLYKESPISSTRIRQAVLDGRLRLVSTLMGYEHIIDLSGLMSKAKGKSFTAERKECSQILPPDGIYKGIFENNQELFATTIILDKEHIVWEQPENVPLERITIRNYEQEET